MRRAIIGLVKRISARFPARVPIVWSVRRHDSRVAITFDDGPTELTAQILECLARHSARATFFVLGDEVSRRPQVLRQILASGHEIAIHGFEHTMRDYYGQVQQCEKLLAEYGVTPRVVRTPGGSLNPVLALRLWYRQYPTVLWSFDARDSMRLEGKWNGPSPDYSRVTGGDIVLMHDDNALCITDLPVLLDSIKQKNLRPVTVSELIGL